MPEKVIAISDFEYLIKTEIAFLRQLQEWQKQLAESMRYVRGGKLTAVMVTMSVFQGKALEMAKNRLGYLENMLTEYEQATQEAERFAAANEYYATQKREDDDGNPIPSCEENNE